MLSPLGARALLGMPAGAVAGIDVHGVDVFGSLADAVCDRLQEATSWAQRFAVVDAALTRLLRGERPAPSPALTWAWHAVVASGGQARVRELALDLGWSERHLANQFRAEFGMTPKVALRVTRFDVTRRRIGAVVVDRIGAAPGLALADVAASGGYADQSHLVREFRALAGLSPSGWVAEEFGNVQAAQPWRCAESGS